MELENMISAARGERPVDLFLANGRIVNVFDGSVEEGGIAIEGSRIVGVGVGDYEAKEVIDLQGRWVAPGFIDGHIHIESSMLPPHTFAQVVVPRGTTAVIVDPHEIANVLGIEGIHYMLESAKYNPLSVYAMLPSLVPATDMETSGAALDADQLAPFIQMPWVLGLAEVPDSLVTLKDGRTLEKIRRIGGERADGHLPGVMGKDLMAVVTAGICSDHESVTLEEGLAKIRGGVHLFIREGSAAKNMEALLPLVTPLSSRRCSFATDDKDPLDLHSQGHMDYILRKAISLGLDPILAIQMVTINTAEYFGLRDLGAIAPGRRADLAIFRDPHDLKVERVYRGGKLVAAEGRLLTSMRERRLPRLRGTVNIHWLKEDEFRLEARPGKLRVLDIVPKQILTQEGLVEPRVEDGVVVADPSRDIVKLAVVERHRASGHVGISFVRGLGLQRGAIASTVAHDSHNIMVAGISDRDMIEAVIELRRMQGGLVVVADGETLAKLPLPIAGLMSGETLDVLVEQVKAIREAAHRQGCIDEPFMHLSFLALPVIPELRLTDQGLVKVSAMEFVSPFQS